MKRNFILLCEHRLVLELFASLLMLGQPLLLRLCNRGYLLVRSLLSKAKTSPFQSPACKALWTR